MKKILAFLLLGAIINVAVAWGCARLYAPLDLAGVPGDVMDDRAVEQWMRTRRGGWPERPTEATRFRFVGVTLYSAYSSRGGVPRVVSELRFGLPLTSMSMEFWGTGADGGHYDDVFPDPPAIYPALGDPGFILPTQPLWRPFAVDTVFWTLALWCIVAAWRMSRRIGRRRRGHCIKCNYDLRGELDAGCPECGEERETSQA